ncbi:WSC domain-containing protein 2-like [Haliotis rubra]|uniref:WSC domain-containing protein 2-like n=1 Tax=Haliotis rubra TaxID=36100 RepID=UPI001EE62345|nr:WSC domain-containing protein 2-like [Haliotis rubra]
MNVEMCIKECSGNRYAGVENGDECWCGASVGDDTKVAEDHCRMQCSGDHGQICGDAWYISVYTTASDFSNVVTKGYISSASGLHMVSGLAASRAHPGYLYVINDNAGADKIYMVHDDTAKVILIRDSIFSDVETYKSKMENSGCRRRRRRRRRRQTIEEEEDSGRRQAMGEKD